MVNVCVASSGKDAGAVDKETFMKAFEDVSQVTVRIIQKSLILEYVKWSLLNMHNHAGL